MNASPSLPAMTADDWLAREIDDHTRFRQRLAENPPTNPAADAARFEEAAFRCLRGIDDNTSPHARLSLLWQAGRYALRAKVYRAAMAERRPGGGSGGAATAPDDEVIVPFRPIRPRPKTDPAAPGAA